MAGLRSRNTAVKRNRCESNSSAAQPAPPSSGVVHGDEEAEYVLAAKKGQRLIIKLTSVPLKSSVFQLLGEDNDTLGLEYDANFDYSGVLPKTGDYFISVKRPTEAKGTSRFKLTVMIK